MADEKAEQTPPANQEQNERTVDQDSAGQAGNQGTTERSTTEKTERTESETIGNR